MKAVLITEQKGLQISDVEIPQMKAGEVTIEVYAAAINRADLLQREGSYPPPPGCPPWPGLEVAGIITATSKNATRFHIGDKVCALLGGGGYAEYVTVPEEMVLPMPKNMTFIQAAAIPEVYATATLNLFILGKAKAGDTLFIHAAGSGLASAIIPMAKEKGLYVITTVRSSQKVKEVAYLHADRVIDMQTENLEDSLKQEAENGHSINLSIDCLGGSMLGKCLPYVAFGCRWIIIATLAGDMSNINFRQVYVKNIQLIGSTLRSKTPSEKGEILRFMQENLWEHFASGKVCPHISAVFPLKDAEKAHDLLYSGKNVGKVVLEVRKE